MFVRRTVLAAALCAIAITAVDASATSLDDGARYAFSASADENRVYAIDLQDPAVVEHIQLGERPQQVLASESLKALIVSHLRERKLSLVDLSDDDRVQIEYPLAITPDVISVSPLGDSVAVYDSGAHRLQVHAVKRRAVLLSIDDVRADTEFTFGPDGSTLYWPDNNTGTLHSVDLWSKRNALQLAEPGQRLSALSRSADGLFGFVSNTDTAEVFVVDLTRFSILARLKVPPAPGRPWGTADGRLMFVTGNDTVTAISTDTLRTAYSVRLSDRPLSVHSGWLDTVAAITGESGKVFFIDVQSGKLLSTHSLSDQPLEAIVTSDSKTMALPLPASGEVAFFDMREQRIATTLSGLPSDIGAATIAISNNLCH